MGGGLAHEQERVRGLAQHAQVGDRPPLRREDEPVAGIAGFEGLDVVRDEAVQERRRVAAVHPHQPARAAVGDPGGRGLLRQRVAEVGGLLPAVHLRDPRAGCEQVVEERRRERHTPQVRSGGARARQLRARRSSRRARAREQLEPEPGAPHPLARERDGDALEVRPRGIDVGRVAQAELE